MDFRPSRRNRNAQSFVRCFLTRIDGCPDLRGVERSIRRGLLACCRTIVVLSCSFTVRDIGEITRTHRQSTVRNVLAEQLCVRAGWVTRNVDTGTAAKSRGKNVKNVKKNDAPAPLFVESRDFRPFPRLDGFLRRIKFNRNPKVVEGCLEQLPEELFSVACRRKREETRLMLIFFRTKNPVYREFQHRCFSDTLW